MFKEIFRFDLFRSLKRPMVYIFTLINFAMVFAASVSDSVRIGGANDAVNVNAPFVIMKTTLLFTLIGVLMTTAFMNSAMLKDYQAKFEGLLFSTSINKLGYLGGRFLSAYVLSLIPFLGVLLAIAVAGALGVLDSNKVGGFSLNYYLSAFVGVIIPNVFIVSSVILALAALLKSTIHSFVGALGLIVLYLLMGSLGGDLDNETVAILSDPLGIQSYDILTKYWTIDEKNTQMIGLSGLWLVNRVIWMTLGFLLVLFTYSGFSFTKRGSKIKNAVESEENEQNRHVSIFQKNEPLPQVAFRDDFSAQWRIFIHQTWLETKGIMRSTPFIIITLFSIVNVLGLTSSIDESYGTGNHPVTYLMVDAIRGSLYLFLVCVLMYYSGALIWKERDSNMNELIDTAPYPSWIPYLSKTSALVFIAALTLSLGIFCGIFTQLLSGYTNIEFGIYFRELLIHDLFRFGGLIALAMFIQTVANNKYLGYFAFIIVVIIFKFGPQALEISSNLVAYGNIPSYIYSDMNGWSLFNVEIFWFTTYWALFAGLLTTIGILFWVRGLENSWIKRMQLVKTRFSGNLTMVVGVLSLLWLTTTGFLYYQTQIVNPTEGVDEVTQNQIDYEKNYKQYQHIAQPRIIALDYHIDIQPELRKFTSEVAVLVKNKTLESIENIHFTLQDQYKVEIKIEGGKQILKDDQLGYQIYQLEKPLLAGEERSIVVHAGYSADGIENEISNTDMVENGTFLSNFKFMPIIGYAPSRELTDEADRKKNNLGFKPSKEKLHSGCSAACKNSYISQDSDWVEVSSTISTSPDQIAIAPGSLVKTWEEGGRKFYKYELEEKVLNFYSFISGKYEVARDQWMSKNGKTVDVEVYYHPGHEYNVDKMIASLKNSLSYFTENFTDYPHQQARIIEFPRYQSFAQAFPGTMPYSESMGFIADLKEKNAIDMVYYYVAHEMAHQWWAHQVIGANVQGATMLSESFAQYSALMVMKKQYGEDKMKQFMRYEMDRYLNGRAKEDKEEMPLMYNEDQAYIHYAKGSVVMYALQEYLGEETINRVLRSFANAKAYQEPPYTNTLDFMDYLRVETPDSLSYLLEDMIESITLYSNKTTNATYRKLDENRYEVSIDVEVEKFRADALGAETLIPHDDYIDIGVFSKKIPEGHRYGKPIAIKRIKVTEKENTFTFIVNEEPYKGGIDPNYLLVDRMPKDNIKVFTLME